MKILDKIKENINKKNITENTERHHYETLAPTSDSESSETINMLSDFLEKKENINIALSGKYGAGKTSIINTFLKQDKKNAYRPLHISLGMFGINNNKQIPEEDQNIFCQEIEKSIIQQIIYKEKPQDLPDSNIKRIKKMPKRSIALMGAIILIVLIIYLISIYNVNINEQVKNMVANIIEVHNLNIKLSKIILLDISIATIALGIFALFTIFLSILWRKLIIKSFKIKLPNTEIEINENSDESLINKYMDELIYFFSKTNYNILIIEDLDRFLENESIKYKILIIFQKLKELSKILNDSKQINRPIKFIYAVKDNLFSNATERTKFFDAIVPVIPVISNFNSYAELKDRFKGEQIPDKIMQDISAHINDFRLIKNISNEYYLYKNELRKNKENSGILDEKIFPIIALKNIKPNLYEELQDDSGNIYKLIKSKDALYNKLKENNENEIEVNKMKIKELQKEKIESIQELKRIAIGGLYGKNGHTSVSRSITMDQFLQNNITLDYIKQNTLYVQSSNGYDFTEKELFEYYNGKENFINRAENIQSINDKEIDKLKNINVQLEKEIKRINEKSLKDIFEQLDKEEIKELLKADDKNKFEIDNFTLMLVSNGYIDENYKNYMFYFKPTKELNEHDYTYIINVRQSTETDFDYKINNPEEVIKQLDISYFGKKEILNYNILDKLLKNNSSQENKEKLNRLAEILLEINNYTQDFMFGFLKYTKNQIAFLQKLYDLDREYIKEVIIYNMEDESKSKRIDYLNKVLLNYPQILKNNEANSYIKEYIEKKQNIEGWLELSENVKESLIILNIKFKYLENINNINLLSFIYDNNLYILNVSMIKELFRYKGFSEKDFEEKNLSIIMHDEKLKKMKEYVVEEKEEYINSCYLKTLGKQNILEDIIECINEWNMDKEINKQMIKNIPGKIKDIKDVDTDYYEELIKNNKIEPTWENYYYFYCQTDNQITDELIHNIELNIEELKKQKVSSITMPEEYKKQFIDFRAMIMKNNKIKIEVYKQIIHICYITLDSIEENELENERLKMLVENKIIKFNDNNLQIIYNQIPEILDVYINNNIELFINGIESYTINENMICDIIKSIIIKFREKSKIINSIDISYINEESMEYIINNYCQNRISKINEKLKEKMFESTLNISYKLTLLEKELDKDNPIDMIHNYLKLLPIPYKYISDYENYPKAFSISKTKNNEQIIEKLENKGVNFTKTVNKNRITIYNKK